MLDLLVDYAGAVALLAVVSIIASLVSVALMGAGRALRDLGR